MMQMLEAGGVEIYTDQVRKADEDNPKGYYELDAVKRLEKDNAWVGEAEGKAIKVISMLLEHLPREYEYKVVFMLRDIGEILRSQQKMLERRGEPDKGPPDAKMRALFEQHLDTVRERIDEAPQFDVLYCSYNHLVSDPRPLAEQAAEFLGAPVDTDAMCSVVDPDLYRQRM
jgi:hypothetical protein